MNHDPLCQAERLAGQTFCFPCDLIARVRADEREQSATGQMIRDRERARIRAKVEGLRHEDECNVSRGRERPETGMAECNCLRADVLALLEDKDG